MSSIDETPNKPRKNHTRIKPSLDGSLNNSILEACTHKIRSGDLLHKIVDELQSASRQTFYDHLKELYSGDDARIARKPPTDRAGEVWYVIVENKDELGLSSEKPAGSATQVTAEKPGRERTFLEDHVMKTAHRILDEISDCSWQKSEMLAISRKSLILENEVMKLSESYPALPSWIEKDVKRAMDCIDFSKAVGEKHPKLRPRPPVTEMIDWQDHWIDVLRVLEGP